MAASVNIPPISYNTAFGTVNKCVWFSVTDNFNLFQLDITYQTNQNYSSVLQVLNWAPPNMIYLWGKKYTATSNPNSVTETIKLTHAPQPVNTTNYVILNNNV